MNGILGVAALSKGERNPDIVDTKELVTDIQSMVAEMCSIEDKSYA